MPNKTTRRHISKEGRNSKKRRDKKSRKDSLSTKYDKINSLDENKLHESLIWFIQTKYSLCDGVDETIAIAEVIVESFVEEMNGTIRSKPDDDADADAGDANGFVAIEDAVNCMSRSLLDYLSPNLSYSTSVEISHIALHYMNGKFENYKTESNALSSTCQLEEEGETLLDETSYESDGEDHDDEVSDSDNEENYIQEGECELCEREVKLTRHHLIPRSTWPRIRPRFLQAAPYFEEGNIEMAEQILNIGSPLPSSLTAHHFSSGSRVKQFLSCFTCDICSMCHKTVHNTFDNLELAESRNSVEKLLEDETIVKFCKWASKQRSRSKRIYKC